MKEAINNIKDIKIINQSKNLIDESFSSIGSTYVDIVADNTSKGDAISHFSAIYNIPEKNRIAIGDDSNDISMFENCGYNVAMGNALPSLKDKADYITLDNNHDGVALYLESLLKDYKGE
jgi:hydroxymethylpyrimidine pyrophosphatase-like HAD family hydrolase